MKTLVIFKTHYINEFVIKEYKKLCQSNSENHNTVLFIDNHKKILDLKDNTPTQKLDFYGEKVECFIFNEEMLNELKLPLFVKERDNADFSKIMWYNCDYPFYIIRKYFPEYDYYWQIESDVYINAPNYRQFFDKWEEDDSDLVINAYCVINRSDTDWAGNPPMDWVYKGKVKALGLFPVVRLSNKAVEYLYNKRIEHSKIYANSKDELKEWIYCEFFVPTECLNAEYKCSDLKEIHVKFGMKYDLETDDRFQTSDNKLYHSVNKVNA